jgi:hypothetical protein
VRLYGKTIRGLARDAAGAALLCGLMFGLSGCRHKAKIAPLPAIQEPVDLVAVAPLEDPPMLEIPTVRMPPAPVAAAAAKPKRERRKVVAKAVPSLTPAPAQAAPAEPSPEVSAIGALTAGEEANPQTKQEAADLIASVERRLNALPSQTEEDKVQISKVRNFWRDAHDALKSGDAEGAMTLATKAKLLLDDMKR